LADEQSTAQRKETILDALGDVVSKVRMRLGEPSESLRKFHTPLARATSGSFDALRAWSAGIKAQQEAGYAAAIPLYERAIKLDPHFARALYSVGLYYRDAQQEGRARDLLSKAFAQRERASARERFRIDGLYYSFVTVEYTKAVETHQQWMQAYPRDEKAVSSLASFYGDVCEYEKSIALFRRARQMAPNNFIIHEDLVELLAASGQFDNAREAYQEMRRRGLDDDAPHVYMYSVDFLQHDTKEMAQEAAWFEGKPLFQHEVLSEHADAEAYMGHLVRARELTKEAVQSALAADNREQAAAWQLNSAWREEVFGNRREAGEQAIRALSIAPESREGSAIAAIILARTGDTARAGALAKDLESRYPQHAVVQSYWLPSIRAQIDFTEGRLAPALRELETAKRYDPLLPQVAYYSHMPSVVLRAEVYLALHQPEEAVKQWETILQWPGIVQLSATAPIAKLKLARALALQAGTGESAARARARTTYQEFLSLWKDADADIPVLREAQVEFAKLQ
jgi:tetratricopeptide (TPR) repeat protein